VTRCERWLAYEATDAEAADWLAEQQAERRRLGALVERARAEQINDGREAMNRSM
jgi:hypothetical protein